MLEEFFKVLLDRDFLTIVFIIGVFLFALGVIGRIGVFIDLSKTRQIILAVVGSLLMVFSCMGAALVIVPIGQQPTAIAQASQQALLVIPSSTNLPNTPLSPEPTVRNLTPRPSQDMSSATSQPKTSEAPMPTAQHSTPQPSQDQSYTSVLFSPTNVCVSGLALIIIIFATVIIMDSYWFVALRQKHYGFDGGAYFYSQARVQALKGEYDLAVNALKDAVKLNDTLFERAESDVAFVQLRTTLVYKIFAQDMTNKKMRQTSGEPDNTKHNE